jgi:hypothetical protein
MTEECLTILNEGDFKVTDAGPLNSPIDRFRIRRDEKLRLILETEVPPTAISAAVDHPPGTIRTSTERVLLRNVDGVDAQLVGVVPFSLPLRTVLGLIP